MKPADAKPRLAALSAAVAPAIADALDTVAQAVAAEARRQLHASRRSRPGDPPGDPSGALAAAIDVDRDPAGVTQVTVASRHAVDLEFGTARMAARPFLRPAVAATGDQARQILAEAFARAVSTMLNESS